jgi:hypothetical protein
LLHSIALGAPGIGVRRYLAACGPVYTECKHETT